MRYLGNFSEVAANEPDVMLAADIFFIHHNVQPKVSGEIADCIWLDPAREARDDLAPLTKNVVLGLVRKHREGAGGCSPTASKPNFLNRLNFVPSVTPVATKIPLAPSGKSAALVCAIPPPQGGAYRDRHER